MKSETPMFADQSLNILVAYFDSKFAHVNQRFDHIDTTLDEHAKLHESHRIRFEKMSKTLDGHTKLLHDHTVLHKSHERKLDSITEALGNTIVNVTALQLKHKDLV